MNPVEFLFFAEDPGAANYLDGIIALMIEKKKSIAVIAVGKAREQFRNRFEMEPEPQLDESAASLLDKYQPRIVIVGTAVNLDTLSLKLVTESRQRGIATFGAVDGPGNEGWRFRGHGDDPLAYVPDKIVVPDDATRQAFIGLGVNPSIVFACGSPHFDTVHNMREMYSKLDRAALRSELLPDAPFDQRVVICAPDPIGGVNPKCQVRSEDYTLHGWGDSDNRSDIFLQEFLDGLDADEGPRPYLILRLHPRSQREDYKVDFNAFDEISQGGEVHSLLYCADLVVALTSILVVEATLLGTPSLSIIPRAKEAAWLSTINLNLTAVATSRDEIHDILPKALKIPRLSIEKVRAAFPVDCARRVLDIIYQ